MKCECRAVYSSEGKRMGAVTCAMHNGAPPPTVGVTVWKDPYAGEWLIAVRADGTAWRAPIRGAQPHQADTSAPWVGDWEPAVKWREAV